MVWKINHKGYMYEDTETNDDILEKTKESAETSNTPKKLLYQDIFGRLYTDSELNAMPESQFECLEIHGTTR